MFGKNLFENMFGKKPEKADAPLPELITACLSGDDTKVKALLDAGANPDTTNSNGKPAIAFTLDLKPTFPGEDSWKAFKCFEALVKKGARLDYKDCKGHSLLFLALASICGARISEYLLKQGFDANEVDSESGADLLDLFGTYKKETYAQMLLNYGAKFERPKDSKGRTRMHSGEANLLAYLDAGLGHDYLNMQDQLGNTPLHYAASNSYAANMVPWGKLRRLQANPNIQNNEGQTPLHIMLLKHQHSAAVKFLSRGRIKWSPPLDLTIKDGLGFTPVDYAVGLNQPVLDAALTEWDVPETTLNEIAQQNEHFKSICAALSVPLFIRSREKKVEKINQPIFATEAERKKLMRDPIVKRLADESIKACSLGVRKASAEELRGVSCLGGALMLEGAATRTECSLCGKPKEILLQIYKKEFAQYEQLPFDQSSDLFCLFWCRNENCISYGEVDQGISWRYGKLQTDEKLRQSAAIEAYNFDVIEITDAFNFLEAEEILGMPAADFIEKYDEKDWFEQFPQVFGPHGGLKIGGYACWIQDPHEVSCACGQKKNLALQIDSACMPERFQFGDCGCIYLFSCKSCGVNSLESLYECF